MIIDDFPWQIYRFIYNVPFPHTRERTPSSSLRPETVNRKTCLTLLFPSSDAEPLSTLASLVESSLESETGEPNSYHRSIIASLSKAASKIQAFWRKRWRYLRSYRASLNSRRGMATATIFKHYIRKYEGVFPLQNYSKNYTLLTTGVDIYLELEKLRDQAEHAHNVSEFLLTNRRIPAESLGELVASECLGDLNEIRRKLEKDPDRAIFGQIADTEVASMYSDLKPTEFDRALKRLLAKVRVIAERLREIVHQLEIIKLRAKKWSGS
ncbi:hypothetical protein K440DRAFT_244356 [Wilcoxina mikolae CBS 423.85]|nr:hypothetical protein K440DRAFT_244356 [Wilcoxina mikolae CBS 423.85]